MVRQNVSERRTLIFLSHSRLRPQLTPPVIIGL